MSDNRIRWTMSLRQRDELLIEHFSDVIEGDRSAECRRLMYLGLEYERLKTQGNLSTPEEESASIEKVTPITRTKVKETDKEKLNKRLDALI